MQLIRLLYLIIPVCICLVIYLVYIGSKFDHLPLGGILSLGGPVHLSSPLSPTNRIIRNITGKDKESTLENTSISDLFNKSLPCNRTGKCRPSSHTKVILVTYMRSGSTFTGNILSAHPGVFYVFEPLHHVNQPNNTIFNYLKRTKIRIGKRKTYMMHTTITGVLNCDFEKIDIDTLTQFHMKNSVKTKPYYNCLTANPGTFGLIHCLPSLYQTCYKAKVVLAKTITLPMKTAMAVASFDPKIKIIHLVRDPRATIWSEGRYGRFKSRDFENFATNFCERLLSDLRALQTLQKRYPDRARLLLYENLAYSPIKITKSLYDFIHLPMTSAVSAHIRNITMSGYEETCAMCVSKADSAKTSQEWRFHLDFGKASFIDNACLPAYRILGYKRLDNLDQYLNISIPLHSWPKI